MDTAPLDETSLLCEHREVRERVIAIVQINSCSQGHGIFCFIFFVMLPFACSVRLDSGFRWWGTCVKESSWRRCRSASTTRCPSSSSSLPMRCSWTTSGPNATNCVKSWSVSNLDHTLILMPRCLPAAWVTSAFLLFQSKNVSLHVCVNLFLHFDPNLLFQVNGDIPPRLKKSAHEVILEFIRSRPPLNPVSTT